MPYVDALVVNTARQGPAQMLGMEGAKASPMPLRRRPVAMAAEPSVMDALTGGEYTRILAQLDRLEVALQVAIVASCVAGVAGLVSLLWPRTR